MQNYASNTAACQCNHCYIVTTATCVTTVATVTVTTIPTQCVRATCCLIYMVQWNYKNYKSLVCVIINTTVTARGGKR